MRVSVLFGGPSAEHPISLLSAVSIVKGLKEAGHEVVPTAIDIKGRWCTVEDSAAILDRTGSTPSEVPSFDGSGTIAQEILRKEVDVVFPVLHGPWGEDGTIQGLIEALGLPCVGCDVAASALCMDKIRSKMIVEHAGFKTAAWTALYTGEDPGAKADDIARLGFPLFIKPCRMGSSVGISKVSRPEELHSAIENARLYDREVLIEEGLDVREIEVAVLGNLETRASLPGEIRASEGFYDFEGKYVDDTSDLLAPAPLDPKTTEMCRKTALEIYRVLGCRGMARVDLFIEKTSGEVYFNEVNTIPGFTRISMYPRLWDISGLPFPKLLDRLLKLCLSP